MFDHMPKALRFRWNVLPHPPYLPELIPSDFALFSSLQITLNYVKLNSHNAVI